MGYAGDVSSKEAWQSLESDPRAVLIDVRTPMEWEQVGVPALNGLKQTPLFLTWDAAQGGAGNAEFLEALRRHVLDSRTPIYFLCRSGGRSRAAAEAAAALGYTSCFNILGGFESPSGGWVASGLPSRVGHP